MPFEDNHRKPVTTNVPLKNIENWKKCTNAWVLDSPPTSKAKFKTLKKSIQYYLSRLRVAIPSVRLGWNGSEAIISFPLLTVMNREGQPHLYREENATSLRQLHGWVCTFWALQKSLTLKKENTHSWRVPLYIEGVSVLASYRRSIAAYRITSRRLHTAPSPTQPPFIPIASRLWKKLLKPLYVVWEILFPLYYNCYYVTNINCP